MTWKQKPPLYSVWASMKDRCQNPRFRQWSDYGGRGIKVCERWKEPGKGFQNFLSDMGPRPNGRRLERTDNNGNYTPQNCCWATAKEQQRNQRTTRWVTINGRKYKAADLADRSGLKTDTVVNRAKEGLPLSKVLSPKKRIFLNGLALGGQANGKRQRNKTHCPQGHEYSAENTFITPQGWRRCRTCHAETERLRRNHRP